MKKNVCKTHEILSYVFFMDIATNIDIVALVWHVYFNVCDYILKNHIGTYSMFCIHCHKHTSCSNRNFVGAEQVIEK